MEWYDIVAPLYDRTIDKTYLPYRKAAVKALGLEPGCSVIDIACGTGLNFGLILDEIGPNGTLIGIDSSAKMLDRAFQKVKTGGWRNVHLLHLDIHRLALNCVEAAAGRSIEIDSVICTLGFTVFRDWQDVFERSFGLLKRGGRYCVMDIFNDEVTLRIRAVRVLANADNSRRVWEPLREKCPDYLEERYPMAHGDTVVVAAGTKP